MRATGRALRQTFCVLICFCLFFDLAAIVLARGNEDAVCRVEINKANPNAPEYFRVTNKTAGDLTINFLLPTANNVTATPTLPRTWVLQPRASESLFSIHPANSRRAWRYEYRFFWRNGRPNARHDDSQRYRLPFPSGQRFRVIQGNNGSFSHFGEYQYAVDFDMPEGSIICAARGGVVVRAEDSFSGRGLTDEYRNRTNVILIQHDDGTIGEYAHLRKGGKLVHMGDTVSTGQKLGYSGDVGYSDGAHLHFGVWKPIDGKTIESIRVTFTDGVNMYNELREQVTYTAH
ncbi:MAG TPA: M23 family metallopeptidase [Candidatus Ozemobacteraceae bacterium]|nr:M23 family metallopeptidase [Candidatus Ozemobacteraceae bacterium]